MALCQPEHTVLDVFFQGLLESITQLTGRPVLMEGLSGPQGMGARAPSAFRPARDYLQLLHQGALALEATGLTYSDAVETLSASAAGRIFAAPTGEMVLAVAGKDPHQGLSVTQGMAGATCTYGERVYERVSDRSARLIFRDEYFGPAWSRAMGLAGLRQVNPELQYRSELESGEPPYKDFTLLLSW